LLVLATLDQKIVGVARLRALRVKNLADAHVPKQAARAEHRVAGKRGARAVLVQTARD